MIIKIQQLSWLAVFYIPNLQLPVVFLSIKLQKNFRFVIRSSSRCLIYKVQCSPLAFQRSSFIIISPNRKLVKKFFQLFSSFGSIRCDDFSSATFIVYHDFIGLSRTFFHFFFKSFCHGRWSLSGNSISLTCSNRFVKHFFASRPVILPNVLVFRVALVECLIRIPLREKKVNTKFRIFRGFVRLHNRNPVFYPLIYACYT